MSCTYGENIKLSIYGQSHAPAIGMTLTGVPAGLSVDIEKLQDFLDRRAPGRNEFSTPRKEADKPEFMSGIKNNCTNGEKIWADSTVGEYTSFTFSLTLDETYDVRQIKGKI